MTPPKLTLVNPTTATDTEPLPVLAVGNLDLDGNWRDRNTRIAKYNSGLLLDQKFLFTHQRCYTNGLWQTLWVQQPGFLHRKPDASQHYGYQICDSSVLRQPGWLHAIYGSQGTVLQPISIHPHVSSKSCDPNLVNSLSEPLLESEHLLARGELDQTAALLIEILKQCPWHPRALFNQGLIAYQHHHFDQAHLAFHQAAYYGHPDALAAEWATLSARSRSFRQAHPTIFSILKDDGPLRVLTQLRALRSEFPRDANAILAYCLRLAHEPEEGKAAALASLAVDPLQSDVYSHLWAYLTDLGEDQTALAIARLHLQLYPRNPAAYSDALDAALFMRKTSLAKAYCYGYLVQGSNRNTMLKHLFKVHEQQQSWSELLNHFDFISGTLARQIPETLVLQAEANIELNNYELAQQLLEQALRITPNDPQIILAYGRCLARWGDRAQALKLVATALNAMPANTDITHRLLLTALLSEILRNEGLLDEALELWESVTISPTDIAHTTGPRPLVEMAYCAAEAGQAVKLGILLGILETSYSEEYIVTQLQERLQA